MNDTPNLALPYILASQAQKHVTHNEAIRALDCLVQLSVESRTLAAPPLSPADGDRFLVAAAATGAWEGQSGNIAAFQDAAWAFYAPKEGWAAWVADEHALIIFDAGTWIPFASGDGAGGGTGDGGGLTSPVANSDLANMANATIKGRASAGSGHPEDLTGPQATALLSAFVGSGASHAKGLVPDPGASAGTSKFLREDATWAEPPSGGGGGDPGDITRLDDLDHIGVNAEGDDTNRLSIKSPASLFDNEGAGHQLKINKHAEGDTASALFQTNYSGRAEMGLTGDDDFHFKVSPDGSTWHDAILIDKDTGAVTFPSTPDSGGGGGDASAVDLALTQIMMQVADLSNLAIFAGSDTSRRVADSFDTLTYVNTGAATNLDTSTAGILKPAMSQIAQADGTIFGDLVSNGGNAAAFNGSAPDGSGTSAVKVSAVSGYVGKNFSSSPKKVSSVVIWSTSDVGFCSSAANCTLSLYGKNGSAPANDADGTLLGTTGSFADAVTAKTIQSNDAGTAWDYLWVRIAPSATDAFGISEVQFFQTAALTVTSIAFTADSPPTTMKGVLRVKEVDAATAGTDYTLEFSRDSGTTWTTATLTELFTYPSPDASIRIVQTNDVDVSGQPSGTGPMWRFKTLNNKNVQLYDAALYWSG